jgi:hypothetical protein
MQMRLRPRISEMDNMVSHKNHCLYRTSSPKICAGAVMHFEHIGNDHSYKMNKKT